MRTWSVLGVGKRVIEKRRWVSARALIAIGTLLCLAGCKNTAKISAEKARAHVDMLVSATATDVLEVRNGLPKGAEHLSQLFQTKTPGADRTSDIAPAAEMPDFQVAQTALSRARQAVQDLRVAKSTFFALVGLDGVVLRTDGEQDLMAGKSLFSAFPDLNPKSKEAYVETQGSMAEAAGVRGRQDGQWVAALPVLHEGKARAVYATGWSWAAYAYRLETSLRSSITSEIGERQNLPLIYVYVVVGEAAHGAPISPDVNAKAIVDTRPLEKAVDQATFSTELNVEGRDFGLAVKRAPLLGKDVAVAVLRSEV